MAHHVLKATPKTVHFRGHSPEIETALHIQSRDSIDVETYSGFNVFKHAPQEFLTPEFLEICYHLPAERYVDRGPHLLTGPIYIEQAEPGDVLEVKLQRITPSLPVGFNANRPGWGALAERFSEGHLRFIHLNLQAGYAEFPEGSGIRIPLRPMFGYLGVATPETRSSIPSGIYGGNIDNPELQAGSRLFLPVFLPGALFSIGDGHAAQGDGEVCGTAIETSMNGTIELTIHKHVKLSVPIAETATDIITTGFAEMLDTAFQIALTNMVDFLAATLSITETEAYSLCSLAANFRITQVVNLPQRGVHGLLPKAIFQGELSL